MGKRLNTIKSKVAEMLVINSNREGNKFLEAFISVLILANVVVVMLESFKGYKLKYGAFFEVFEVVTVSVFSVEYLLRLWVADIRYPKAGTVGSRVKFVLSGGGLIDLLAILPFYLPFFVTTDLRVLRSLRLMRLLWILKLNRYSKSMRLVGQVLMSKKTDIFVTVFVTLLLMSIAATLMYDIEHEAQPDVFANVLDAFWWSIATLTTVGYGDIYPITGWGRFFGGVIAVLGIGLVALPTGIISSAFLEQLDAQKEKKKKKAEKKKGVEEYPYNFCPHCGEKLKDGQHP
ncbi:hypothetical protein FUAX_11900 [Fulvitalea axinellae]|uniref:Ion transport domain-containing protein n=1 Tax=Fulvitalea axinellae TaxID=1182444 RepID=A0AAU9CFK9_9BACT|nr:hypothetical protein FUAX_11900 [Fulvitalea axinellae]